MWSRKQDRRLGMRNGTFVYQIGLPKYSTLHSITKNNYSVSGCQYSRRQFLQFLHVNQRAVTGRERSTPRKAAFSRETMHFHAHPVRTADNLLEASVSQSHPLKKKNHFRTKIFSHLEITGTCNPGLRGELLDWVNVLLQIYM